MIPSEKAIVEALNKIAFALDKIATATTWVAATIMVLAIATCAIAGAGGFR